MHHVNLRLRTRSALGTVFALAAATTFAGCADAPNATDTTSGSTAAPATPVEARASSAAPAPTGGVRSRLARLEERRDARLGVAAIDTGTGRTLGYRADERFAMASTVKVPLAATVLHQLSGRDLERRLYWSEDDLVPYSPITEMYVEDGMTVRQVIDAALTQSDNTAANVLFELAGGPAAVQDRLGELGDTTTSVDRVEPGLNDWEPGEVRDTSTPRALADTLRRLTLGDGLTRPDRRLLNDEMGDAVTGAGLVRAGVPTSWRVGDKSGSASYGIRNDVAVVHPPGRAPWVVVVLTSHDSPDAETDDELVAAATRIVVDGWS